MFREELGMKPGEQLVTALYVHDLRKSRDFYQSLGFKLNRQDRNFTELEWDGALLFLVEMPDAPTSPIQPVGNIRILVSNVDEHWERCKRLGVEILRPIETRDYGLRDFLVGGPDGLSIRFATLVKK
jgi:catechol 2,3-dioxygenase-like lactoylglutathione lyase family enzyme